MGLLSVSASISIFLNICFTSWLADASMARSTLDANGNLKFFKFPGSLTSQDSAMKQKIFVDELYTIIKLPI